MSYILFQRFDLLFDKSLDLLQLRKVELSVGEERGEVALRAVEIIGDDGPELALEMLRLGHAGIVFVVPAVGPESHESLSHDHADDGGYRRIRRPGLRERRNDILQKALFELPQDSHQLFFPFGQFLPVMDERKTSL